MTDLNPRDPGSGSPRIPGAMLVLILLAVVAAIGTYLWMMAPKK
ncbi:MAG: hypothetical protein U1F36_02785 [Planctomycetota bacterium]